MDAEILDSVLDLFYQYKQDTITPFNDWRKTNVKESDFYDAIEHLQNLGFVEKLNSGNLTTVVNGVYRITYLGTSLKENEGFKKKSADLESNALKTKEKENLEMQKLRTEVSLITNQLLDYDKVKSRTSRNEVISIIALVLTLIGLGLQWLSRKNG